MVLPWKVQPEDLTGLAEYYPDAGDQGVQTIHAFYWSGFEVPSMAIFALYLAVVTLVALNAAKHTLRFLVPTTYAHARARLAPLRSHVVNSALLGRKHSEPYYVLGRRWLPVRAPLRGQACIVAALVLFNIVPLFAFYRITPDWNVYWPGSTSHRDQLARYLADRSCVLAMGQLPLVFLTSGRTSLLILFTGLEYADSMLYHRWLARMVWLQVSVHSFAYTYIEAVNGYLGESFKEAYWNWGVAATAMFWGLTILAYGQLRTRAYELFVALHIVMGIMALVGVYFHIHLLDYWKYKMFIVLTEISAAAWAFDRLLRAANRLYTSVRIRRHGVCATASLRRHGTDLLSMRIALPLSRVQLPGADGAGTVASRIAPGHSVRILVPRVQWFSDHPFTVIGTGRLEDEDGLGFIDLLIRMQGGFTRRLAGAAAAAAVREAAVGGADVEAAGGAGLRRMAVVVEGPYGALHHADGQGAGHVLLFAGGVGVAYTLAFLVETARRYPGVPCTMVWMLRDMALFEAVIEQLEATARELRAHTNEATALQRAPLNIRLYITSASAQSSFDALPELDKDAGQDGARTPSCESGGEKAIPDARLLEPYFTIRTSYGRASINFADHVAEAEAEAAAAAVVQQDGLLKTLPCASSPASIDTAQQKDDGTTESGRRLVVAACGPASLCDDVRYEAQRELRAGKVWSDVVYHEECFNW